MEPILMTAVEGRLLCISIMIVLLLSLQPFTCLWSLSLELACSGGEIGYPIDFINKFGGMFGEGKSPENVILATKRFEDYSWALLISVPVQSCTAPDNWKRAIYAKPCQCARWQCEIADLGAAADSVYHSVIKSAKNKCENKKIKLLNKTVCNISLEIEIHGFNIQCTDP